MQYMATSHMLINMWEVKLLGSDSSIFSTIQVLQSACYFCLL